MAAGYVFFITPYKIVPGGVYGICIVMHYLWGLPVGIMGLLLNIPLTILGIKILGPRFGVKTVVGFTLTSLFMDGISYFSEYKPLVENDFFLSAGFGGVLAGIGLGLIFRAKATSGGSDIVAMILEKYTRMPVGQLLIVVDSIIVLLGLVAFGDWKIPLYSWIVIFITGKVIDAILQGISYNKTVFIISDKYEELREKIIFDIERGGTLIKAEGMYQGKPKNIIFTNVNRRELSILQKFIHTIDPNAFVTVIDANEVIGHGFKPLSEKVEQQ